jgi:FkbM family methyltransferase
MNLEEKKIFLLEEINKFEKFLKEWNKVGWTDFDFFSRLKRNLSRFLYSPLATFSFLTFRALPIKKKIKILKLRDIVLQGGNASSSMVYFGFLIDTIELKLTKFFIKNFKPNDIFYDVGANYGYYTFLALEFCKEVHSFEPIKECVESLRFNLKNNDKVYINEVALADKEGVTKFYIAGNLYGLSSIKSNVLSFKNLNTREVLTTTLDKYIYEANHNPPTVIKIDVEGAELEVLRGGEKFLKNSSPVISLEVWGKDNNGELSMQAVNFLRNLGYKSYYIRENGEIEEKQGNLFAITKGFDNFIFKK